MNAPKLRFKGEDGQEFGNWNTQPLAELAKIYDGTHMTPDYQESGIPFYSVEHVTANNFSDTKFISREVFEKENKRVKLERGDILMTRIGDIGTPKYIDWDVEASFYVSLALIKQSEKINSLFLSHYINTNIFQKELHQRIIHVAFPKKINLGEIGNCSVAYPCDKEQTKIANFLMAVDEKITKLTQKSDLLAQYKKGVKQKIFSQELRFKDDDGREFPEWEKREVGEIFRVTRGNVLAMPLVSDLPTDTHKYPVYSSQTKNNGLSGYYDEYLFENCITWTTDGANAGDVNFRRGKFYCTNVCGVLVNDKGNANACIAAMINNVSRKYVSYVGNPKLMNGVMAKITIEFPCVQEQSKIANFLTAIDDKITQTQAELDAVKQYKQGLLQQMFV